MKWSVIAITGASSGLGWQMALLLAAPGKHLLLFGRDEQRLSHLKALVEEKKASCEICVADFLLPEGVQKAIQKLKEISPSLLVHSAGIGRYGHFCESPEKASLDIMRLNVLSVMEITHAWARHIKEQLWLIKPKVVFIASAAAFLPFPGMATYAASKACLLSFAEALRYEEQEHFDVLTFCPGKFATNFQKRASLSPLENPSTEEARVVAEKSIVALLKNGVYVPFPWNWILPLRYLLPKKLLMRFLERRILSRCHRHRDL